MRAFAFLVFLATLYAVAPYRRAWLRRMPNVPTGFGVLLAPALLLATLVVESPPSLRVALTVATLATAVYWWDDVVEIRARIRLAISVAAGMAFAAAFALDGVIDPLVLAADMLVAGVVSACLVNMVNFQDGADLNLATFVALTGGVLLAFAPAGTPWPTVALTCLAFAAAFAVWNCRRRTIYLGDSGSFAFASLLTILGLYFIRSGSKVPPEVAIPAALPALDVAFVFYTRVREKHDLLTRNYLHLYQKLDARYPRFAYLVPQGVNVVLCLGAAAALQTAGVPRDVAVIGGSAVVTIIFYFACRLAFVPRDA